MPKTSLSHSVKSYLAACVALTLTIALIINVFFFSELALHWSAVLWACLILAQIAVLIQQIRTEKNLQNQINQSLIVKERLTNEIKHRLWAEKSASESKIKSLFIDENIPVMLAYFNTDLRCRYHNRIFRKWFGLKPDQIDERLLTEFSSEEFFTDIKQCAADILAGKTIHNERVLKSTKGFPYIFTEQYVPHLNNKGKAIGFYTIHTPRTQEKNRASLKNKAEHSSGSKPKTIVEIPAPHHAPMQPAVHPVSPKATTTAARIAQAIEGGEFNLYYQHISPIKPSSSAASHYEILIRMNEEDNNLMPPGSFLPFVDQFNLMPQLDRWIVNHIVTWLSIHPENQSVFCLNVAKDTLSDRAFPEFIQEQLKNMNVTATNLCFEIEVADAEASAADMIVFSNKIHDLGCLLSLCSFSNDPSSVALLDKIKIDYLKIDGSLICNILRDQEDLDKVISIHRLAQKSAIKTIAELVETDDIVMKLQEIGIDYAQGFGIAKAHPFRDLEA
ncbi:EAL domain-containing protein [Nitrosomonas sp. JL21]|uniref:sensor domain-containing phosphodiesterase n=1 Tax=Nitrosomonas sp. JL21 TaxID=153949 RepID=UPI00136A4E39|nr:EAL domain-containing protein [Nitrosomonas sp. JL21]MBL8496718.1 EAL domain-containing protein [Nitrosomonas sp.]MXS76544.1 EAL domain-containing protein [Nitrosomonas sp. JL21]